MLRIPGFNYCIRLLSTEVVPKTGKIPKPPKLPKESGKPPADISEYFANHGREDILKQFPSKFLRKKFKPPDNYYLASNEAAEIIASHILKSTSRTDAIIECGPGLGLLTKLLVASNASKVHLFEGCENFEKNLKETYAGKKRIQIHTGDLINMWKAAYQDRIDNGNRVQEVLEGLPTRSWTAKPLRLFAAVGSLNFFKHLIFSMSRQSELCALGRFEMYLVVPPPLYAHLTCDRKAGYLLYRANTILFQIMFEHKFLTKISRKDLIPWQHETKLKKHTKLTKFYSIDADCLYLIKITPRSEIYDLCPLEHMQALVYFIKQNCISRKHRIIPMLEKWAPGCGPRLIVNRENPEPIKRLHPRHSIEIPQFSTHCTTMSTKDFYPNMNIFTEFGDLSPSQMLSLFSQFRKWPEFKDSTFLASLESSLLKMEISDQETIDSLEIQEEDYIGSEESKAKEESEKS